ncbi:sulfate ABC transporter substrate-binding protein [Cohnella sp. REN36]|uniref:sulfate ABC transporter substrate-binding protein n=1 Tax=Cohnella sp. REN36 TaxID=2887347 RepID=UPI001D138C12|nr:sulfate ABC transporter substrate-binding protein [Cohnella sp. REN36]MCC3376855.1 sulfate ABC transporter substrate-binding protein [Cohnella sp. REN36]
MFKKKTTAAATLLAFSLALAACASGDGKPMDASADDGASPSASSDYAKPIALTGASPDGTAPLFQALNDGFVSFWKEKTGQSVTIDQTTGASDRQEAAINDGKLQADLVTLGIGTDIDAIQAKGLIGEGWQQRYDYNSSPFFTTVAFAVRSGNPKGIKTWDDLAKPGVKVVVADPKSYGDARWFYVGAWAHALGKDGDENAAKAFVGAVYKNAPRLEADEAAARARFVDRADGDVWITTEAEALALANGDAKGKLDVVVPPTTLAVEPIVSVVDRNADAHGTREAANGYADYLFTEQAQKIAAQHFYRPRFASVAEQFASRFPETTLLTVDDSLDGWEDLNARQFADGGNFDQLVGAGR